MSDAEQEAAGCVIGRDYPAPIVDHKRERERAIERYRAVSGAVSHTALILGDQLSHDNPALEGAARVLLVESRAALAPRATRHRQRRHLVPQRDAPLRGRAARARAVEVVERAASRRFADGAARRARRRLRGAERQARRAPRPRGASASRFVPSTQFLTAPEDFAAWADGRRRLVMEDFYREQRRRFGLLVEPDGKPAGGRWNFDRENRRPPRGRAAARPQPWLPARGRDRRGGARATSTPWACDGVGRGRRRARGRRRRPRRGAALDDFVAHRLPRLRARGRTRWCPGERWLFHARLSSSLNLGLLDPLERVPRGRGRVPRAATCRCSSAEGFIRQVIGWREYVWGMYWLRATLARRTTRWAPTRPLPDGVLDRRDGRELPARAASATCARRGYAHHIQRLMVLGNLMLLLGVRPWEAVEWFQDRVHRRRRVGDGAERRRGWRRGPTAAR